MFFKNKNWGFWEDGSCGEVVFEFPQYFSQNRQMDNI